MSQKATNPAGCSSAPGRLTSSVATATTITEEILPNGEPKSLFAPRGSRPLAFASQAAPCAGRTQWHVMYQCGACGGTHFGRSAAELVTGRRRARCGRVVFLVIARTYRGTGDGVAA